MTERAHGTRARYVFGPGPGQDRSKGCRCELCCEANRAYARYQGKRKRLEALSLSSGPWAPPFVDAGPARARILELGERGVGYKRVAELASLGKTAVLDIRNGRRDRIRRETADALLAVSLEAEPAGGQLAPAAPTWKLVRAILRRPGWSKARISAEIGTGGRALQLGRRRVTVRNARLIAELAERLDVVRPPADERRFPLEPLLKFRTVAELARQTGIAAATFHRYRRTGGLPASRADAVAVAVGCHPLELWPDWYDDQAEDVA